MGRRPLAQFFGDTPLRKISPADLTAYQNTRRDLGRAPKTVNSERRKALDEAAKALEPDVTPTVSTPPDPPVSAPMVMSHVTSQQRPLRSTVIDFPRKLVRPARLELATSWFVVRSRDSRAELDGAILSSRTGHDPDVRTSRRVTPFSTV